MLEIPVTILQKFKHHKYAIEAFRLLTLSSNISTPLVQNQLIWSRTINSQGGAGRNIPIDLQNEHLNRSLKDAILGMGANVSTDTIVNISKSIQTLNSVAENFDKE